MAFAAAAFFSHGCGQEGRVRAYPVRGQVLVQKKPARLAFVVFHPTKAGGTKFVTPCAYADAEGKFQLSTYGANDGAPAGEYVVTITWTGADDEENRDRLPDKLQGRYSDPKSSPLKVTVKEGANDLTAFHLK